VPIQGPLAEQLEPLEHFALPVLAGAAEPQHEHRDQLHHREQHREAEQHQGQQEVAGLEEAADSGQDRELVVAEEALELERRQLDAVQERPQRDDGQQGDVEAPRMGAPERQTLRHGGSKRPKAILGRAARRRRRGCQRLGAGRSAFSAGMKPRSFSRCAHLFCARRGTPRHLARSW
jgi:hypothetical protein